MGRIILKNMKEKIVFATSNEDKLREIKNIIGDEYEVVTMKSIGFNDEIDENGTTFEENALIKARAVSKSTDCIVLADDSGLEIDYFGKEPGVYSARYLGHDTPYSKKNSIILERLKDVPDKDRTARFVCAVACVMPNGNEKIFKATMEGIIAKKSAGERGFGYDPIFFLPEYGMTSAQLTADEKNRISHRGKALRMMKEELCKRPK